MYNKKKLKLQNELIILCSNQNINIQESVKKIKELKAKIGNEFQLASMYTSLDKPTLIPAIIACRSENIPVLEFLIKEYKNTKEDNYNLLMESVSHEKIKSVEYLIKIGVNVQHNDNELILNATRYKSLGIIKMLIDNGADITAQNGKAFQYAVAFSSPEVILYLVKEHSFSILEAKEIAQSKGNKKIVQWCDEYIIKKELHDKLNEDLKMSSLTNKKNKI